MVDVFVPDPLVVLRELHGDEVLEGRVVDVSRTGADGEDFAVVEVDGLRPRLVVPVARVEVGG